MSIRKYRLQEAIDQYLGHRKANGYSPNTLRNDRRAIDALLLAAGNIQCDNLTPGHVDTVIETAAHRLSDASLNTFQASLAAFCKWGAGRGILPPGLMAGRRYRKVMRKDRTIIEPSRFAHLLDSAGTNHPRDRALVAVGLYLMLRQSEATDLRVGDVHLDRGLITVRVFKTRQVDDMPISAELDTELRTWLTLYTASCGPLRPEWYLLPSRTSHAMVRGADGRYIRTEQKAGLRPLRPVGRPEDVVRRAMNTAGVPTSEREGMHTLRRSGARALFDELTASGFDGALRTVQTFLHHASGQMTERYLGITIDRHQRDQAYAGKPLFPSLAASNVVRLDAPHGESGARAV